MCLNGFLNYITSSFLCQPLFAYIKIVMLEAYSQMIDKVTLLLYLILMLLNVFLLKIIFLLTIFQYIGAKRVKILFCSVGLTDQKQSN